jgi:hypothetical protein
MNVYFLTAITERTFTYYSVPERNR